MVVLRLPLLLIFNCINLIGTAPANIPVLRWHRSNFRDSDTTLKFKINQKLSISCEGDSYGTISEVSERCFNSCSPENCNSTNGDKMKEFFVCNQEIVGPVTLRTMSPHPRALTFTAHKIHYFTSLDNSSRGGRPSTLCRDGMKFKMVVSNEFDEETHRTTMDHPLFSTSLFHHTHPSSPSTEKTKPTRVQSIESTTMTTSIKSEIEETREENIQEPMLTDKMSMEEMDRIDRLTSYPSVPYKFHNLRYDIKNPINHKLTRIDGTVKYGDNGEIDQFYEVALPLGIDPNSSSMAFSYLSITIIFILLAILL